MHIHLVQPLALLLLGLVPLAWWMSRRLRSLSSKRRWGVRIIRVIVLTLITLALADPQITFPSRELTVFYVLDQSDSVPGEQRKQATEAIQAASARMTSNDNAGMVVFGAQPSIEDNAAKKYEFRGQVRSAIATSRTNIASALRLAMAGFPPDTMKRIVLLSDGNENEGGAVDVARLARGNNIPIDVVPLRYRDRLDLQVDKIVSPQQAPLNAPFEIKVFAQTREDTRAMLRVFQDDQLVGEYDVDVKAGQRNVYPLQMKLGTGGFHTFRAELVADGDARTENNKASTFTYVKAKPRVLYVEGSQDGETNFLAPALRLQEVEVELIGAEEFPQSLERLQGFDSIILSNVSASAFSQSQMEMIERSVHELGIGLVMIGGENSFGAGGYQDTPIEKALPVSMDIKQKKVLPNGALVLILHTCEIAAGNSWAREIAIASLNVLSRRDLFGVLYYGQATGSTVGGMSGWGENWAWEPALQESGDKRRMRSVIRGLAPADMPTFDPTLEKAYKELKKVKAEAKHIVIISDGDPAPPKQSLANNIKAEGISISTVAIAPHDGRTVDTMKNMAFWGGGNFYFAKSASELPRIFVKEATVVRRSLISEKVFQPMGAQMSDILTGITAVPQLRGHVATSVKDQTTLALKTPDDDPVLAHWRYGLGKTVAFTSDARNKWGADWISWEAYAKFWAQLVRWSMRETASGNFQVQTTIEGGRGKITVDAVDDEGNFQNFLEFKGGVITPENKSLPVEMKQVAPGRYEGEFPAKDVGTYMTSLLSEKGERREQAIGGVSLSYSPEYEQSRSNDALLESIARDSGGVFVEDLAKWNPFRHDLPISGRATPIWVWLVLLALLLFPIDIFLRRVYVDWGEVGEWISERYGLVSAKLRARRKAEQTEERLATLKGAKARALTPGEKSADAAGESAATDSSNAPPLPMGDDTNVTAAEARARLRQQIAARSEQMPADQQSVFQPPPPGAGGGHASGKQTFGPASDAPPGGQGAPPAGGDSGLAGGLLEAKRRARKKF